MHDQVNEPADDRAGPPLDLTQATAVARRVLGAYNSLQDISPCATVDDVTWLLAKALDALLAALPEPDCAEQQR